MQDKKWLWIILILGGSLLAPTAHGQGQVILPGPYAPYPTPPAAATAAPGPAGPLATGMEPPLPGMTGGCGSCQGGGGLGEAGQVAGAGRFPQRTGCAVPQSHARRFVNNFGLGCWTHHDQFGCSSFWSEFRFVFGSCRAFFGEPCSQGPPRIPVPPGYVPPQGPPAPGYLPASQYRRHY